jgi:hypothetical protein
MPCFATFTLSKGKNQDNPREFMILNKFSTISLVRMLKTFSLQFFALSLFSCNKSANINANKALVALIHVAYEVGPLNINFNGDSLLDAGISFGGHSGTATNPYDTTVSRISELQLFGDTVNLSGNAAFQQNVHYSLFAYDTLNTESIALLILQDNLLIPVDTLVNFRFLNFSPGSQIGLKLIYTHDTTIYIQDIADPTNLDTLNISVRDTVVISPSFFVGYNPNPVSYPINHTAHIGFNQVFAFVESSIPLSDSSNFKRLDPLTLDSTKSYNIYLQGYFGSHTPQDSLQIKSIQLY